jgi:hypothetical protein
MPSGPPRTIRPGSQRPRSTARLAGLELDHVLIAVAGLDDGARGVETRLGLASVAGGRHAGFGTANRIVPLGDAYLELVAVADRARAAASVLGRWVAAAPSGGLLGWAVRTDDLGAVATRLGLSVADGSRTVPDGRVLRWRTAGLEQAAAEPYLPFFIEWAEGTEPPGHAAVTYPAGPAHIAGLRLSGDSERLSEWLGGHTLPIGISAGAPKLLGVSIAGPAGLVTL